MKTTAHAMKLALDLAWDYQLLTFPNPAVGAVCISADGAILSVGAHKVAGGPHAEVYALRDAYSLLSGDNTLAECYDAHTIHDYLRTHHNNIFNSVSMAVTLEPCSHSGKTPSCALLIRDLGIKELFIACKDPNPQAANGGKILEDAGIKCTFEVMESEGQKLLEPFIKWQNSPFVFFKWAQRLDGTIDNGIISSEMSRKHVHALREQCDLIVIGGNTVRHDRPSLDARLVNGKAPDVLIYSQKSDFDITIPLFSIPNRQVFIASDFERIKEYRLVMIEGGVGMFEASREVCDWYLSYIAPKIGGGLQTLGIITEDFEVLHAKITDNIILWMKKK
ncbi:MAG: bifunctional diaminohydroxyphosphoribosylaminopyrimidine deaminase/5-amino-6-(5-phosphoribosylamino)uracil reductase RibD [Sulfuricurvum sp.]|uniref:bifunctional diaminohydroxyphosphoribosylaminopyrimidine deaminase/5-amino-6-(5-phosphoribosylamino)uracil reductase RibD n=1 Tax=Sulfuricurvum sp. TaxID=2025608 RepID=UPI002602E60A|nr:bifunctional diaminohydroxyphosphoribosylaminopyrimidine deaminase/5-amino-6-(5-phosphoribosylamino)uracil reductase RibD [Sulfuricurvum sp.]MDD2829968.1 bifunctional diaminohydroxyphosphoribosylaminopyrimidine deaminase/5-amino-6-(5-phosphoribosylamino)uracil reductase RibD [Sulfuricurvum sp.]MDD4949073.1 bifunctional diaminohydroxyphosphoribosylaminopyrimidine deaminase/5-amino-6-(5-phosphoribosylamino)uracil reductase RibD [Sulfuricurvum sp.]